MSDDLIGKTIGGYEILERIGQGGMATVYRARQKSMNRTVALKILPRHLLRDETYLQRFEREVRIVAQLEHRNIVPVHDYGEHDGQPYIAMRYMPAGSVDDLLAQGPIPVERVLSIVEQVAPALDYAHTKNVLHRDLKPSNILLDDENGAYITDFGIARLLGQDQETQGITLTAHGVIGTPSYMSPEQAQGQPLDGRSDVYSLGIMLFEMLTGRRPFQNETPYGVAVMQVTTPPPSPRSINPVLTLAVEQVIFTALKKKPENRYQTAVQLAEALRLAVERPDSIFDTQPRGIPIQDGLDVTQPHGGPQGGPHSGPQGGDYTVPATPAEPQPAYTPPQPPPAYTPPPISQSLRPASIPARARRRAARYPGSVWLGVVAGGLLGCALLTMVVAAAIVTINNLFSDPVPPTLTVPPTLDPTSAAAREAALGGMANTPGMTPVFMLATPIPTRTPVPEPSPGVAPVGVRETPTPDAELPPQTPALIYFARRGGTDGIFHYDLRTGVETRLTHDTASSTHPRVSPDFSRIVFQTVRDGRADIFVMDLGSRQTIQLTADDADNRLPSWSPDGRWIVYAASSGEGGAYDLYRVRADGSGTPQLIYADGQRNSHPRFSPDGSAIVFTGGHPRDATTWEIRRLDLLTGEVIDLTDNNVRDAAPTFSPDGERIVFVTDGAGGAAVASMAAAGGPVELLHDDDGFAWGVDFSADGSLLVFNSQRGDRSTLLIMRADGSGVRRIENVSGFYPSWAPAL